MRINCQKNEFVHIIYKNKYDDENKFKKNLDLFSFIIKKN